MFGAEENDADPAQIKQLHLVVVSPVDLDDGDLAEQSCGWPADHARYCRVPYLPQVSVRQDRLLVKLAMEELDTLPS